MSEPVGTVDESGSGDGGSWRRALLPLSFELAAYGGLLTAVVFLRLHGLSLDRVTLGYTVVPLLLPAAQALAVGVLLQVVYRVVSRRPLRSYLATVASLPWLILALRIWLACLAITYTYMWLKVSVPLVNWALWDGPLWRLDIVLHLGFSPSVFAVELLGGSGLLPWIDLWYGAWMTSMMLAIGFFCASPRARVRRRFLLAVTLLWVLGAWIYMALPAVGPIYTQSAVFADVGEEMPAASAAQAALWENYQLMLAGRTQPLRRFKPALGVAAMPSLHVAGHWLLALAAWRWARPLRVPAILAALLTLLGSVATGWHYAIDGYVGIALAFGVFYGAIAWDRAMSGPATGSADGEEPSGR